MLLQSDVTDLRGGFVHLRILAISHCDIAVSHLISSSLPPLTRPSHLIRENSTTSSFLTPRIPSCLISSLVISRSQRPRAVRSFLSKVKTNLPRLHPIRIAEPSTVVQIKQYVLITAQNLPSTNTFDLMENFRNYHIVLLIPFI